MKKLTILVGLVMAVAVTVAIVAATTTSAGGNPTLFPGNPDCTAVRSDLLQAIKLEDAADLAAGTYDLPELVNGVQYSVTLLNVTFNSDIPPELIGFDWTSTLSIDAVIVKTFDNANVYTYNEATEDTGLQAPDFSGSPAAIAHITFCYDKKQMTPTPTAGPSPTPTNTLTPTNTPTARPSPTPTAPPAVGGIAELPEVAGTPLETDGSSGPSAGLLAGVVGATAIGAIALGGAAWYTRRRWL